MMSVKDYEKVVHFISRMQSEYQNNHNFRSLVLNLISEILGFNCQLGFFLTDNNNQIVTPNLISLNCEGMQQSMQLYQEYYYKKDILHTATISKDFLKKNVVTIRDIISYKEYEKTEYYNNILKYCDLYYQVMLPLKVDNRLIGVIFIIRSKDMGEFSKRELLVLDKINPLISNNFKMNLDTYKVKYEHHIFKGCSDQMPLGLVVLDSKFSVLYFNDTAKKFCADIAGDRKGIDPVQRSVNLLASKLLSPDSRTNSYYIISISNYSFKLMSSIIPSLSNTLETIYALYITHNSLGTKAELQQTTQSFGLTSREIEIVKLIEKGLSNQEISDKLFISPHTVKAHTENIFKKMNVKSRTAAIHKINEAKKPITITDAVNCF